VRQWTYQPADATEPGQDLLASLDVLLTQAQCTRADLSAVAFNQGPGGFTGLRVACGLAQGLAFALDIPVIAVSSLLAVAAHDHAVAAAPEPCARVVMQDARMQELYVAVYGLDAPTQRWRTLHPPGLIRAQFLPQWLAQARHDWVDAQGQRLALRAVGDALDLYPEFATLDVFDSTGCRHADVQTLARLALQAWDRGEILPPELAAPLYVRDKIAYTTRERAQGLGGNPRADDIACAGSPPVIVPMGGEHLSQVTQIERSVQSFPWTLGNFQDALQANNGAWVALDGDKVQGFCVVLFAPDVAHLLVLAVARECQRRGIGRWLVHHAEQQARRRRLDALLLEVRPSNHGARAFYQQLGFETLSIRKDYYPAGCGQREDAMVLRKSIAPHAMTETVSMMPGV